MRLDAAVLKGVANPVEAVTVIALLLLLPSTGTFALRRICGRRSA
ncbi:MAG: hypothetical protein ABI614_05010 [Planctomycetota bacterium]